MTLVLPITPRSERTKLTHEEQAIALAQVHGVRIIDNTVAFRDGYVLYAPPECGFGPMLKTMVCAKHYQGVLRHLKRLNYVQKAHVDVPF